MDGTPSAKVRVAGVVLLRENGAALLQHRDDKPGLSASGQWVFPGGHCETSESCRDCARREFLEETGYDCTDLRPLIEFPHTCPATGRSLTMSFWWAQYDGITPTHCYEGQELRFLAREEIARHLIPDYILRVWDFALVAEKTLRKNDRG